MTKLNQQIFVLFFLIFAQVLSAKNIYVSNTGNDANDGSENNPYKTFSKAVSVMTAGDVCIIKGGVYEQSLVINKNGNASNYLIFKAADGEKVEIKATTQVTGWQNHQGNIYKAAVSMGIDSRFRAVYHNTNYMDLARWPNNTDNDRWTIDCTTVTGGDGSHFLVNTMPDIDWSGGIVYYLGAHSGTSWTRTITSNTTTRINHAGVDINKWPFSNHNPTWLEGSPDNRRGQLYLFNKLEALDYANEWYYDATSQMLYLQTEDGNMPADNSVEFATHKFAVELKGDYIKLQGLDIFGGSVKIHNNADNNTIENCSIIHGSEGHDSLTNTSAQVGDAALEVLGDNTVISGCTIDHSSVSGIVVSGWAASNVTLEKNTIKNIDYVGIHASPIRCSANNSKVLKNYIENAARDGMYVTGVNFEVAYNDVSHSQLINSDSGIFYTVGNDNLRNAEIHHNWFHDAQAPEYSHQPGKPGKAAGIYLDNDSKGFTVHHNVVWNVSWTGYQINWNNTYLDFFHNTLWQPYEAMGSWVNGYPQADNKVYNNYSSHPDWFAGENGNEFDIKNNLIDSNSPFEAADNQNFYPKVGSAVVDKAPVISGFDKPYKGASPDIGAYELGGTRWTAGINAIEDTGEGDTWSIYDTKFTIVTNSESCPAQQDGQLSISADFYENYKATFNGTTYAFNDEKGIENISPGTYELCISIDGNSDQQCFSLVINEASQIASKSVLKDNYISYSIEQGTAPFEVSINNKIYLKTAALEFDIPVNKGDKISLKSSKECEGELTEKINFSTIIASYPNPISTDFTIEFQGNDGSIPIAIYNSNMQLLSEKNYKINSGKITVDMSHLPSGIYMAKILTDELEVLKIIKL